MSFCIKDENKNTLVCIEVFGDDEIQVDVKLELHNTYFANLLRTNPIGADLYEVVMNEISQLSLRYIVPLEGDVPFISKGSAFKFVQNETYNACERLEDIIKLHVSRD